MLIPKITVLLLAAWLACRLLRGSSAAARQLVWTLALAGVLFLPVVSLSVPAVRPKISARIAVIATSVAGEPVEPPSPARARTPWSRLYWTGVVLLVIRMLLGSLRVARIARRAQPFPGAPAHIRLTERLTLPVTWGLFKPVILLPTAALKWPPERLRLVIAHETAHIRRWDFLGQIAAQSTCAIYWFHPLIWWAFKQLIKEREQACDDEVLNMGVKGTVYADHLLNIIRGARQENPVLSPSVGMAQASAFEYRLQAMLNPGLNRQAPSRRVCVGSTVLSVALLLLFGALRLPSQTVNTSIAGVVRDPSGAVIPKATFTASSLDGASVDAAVSGQDGSFHIDGLKAGRYRVQVLAAGFAPYQAELSVAAGSATKLDPELSVGAISESFEVLGKRAAGLPHAAPQRIRVGGMVQASKLLVQVPPIYPEAALQKGIEGTVLLHAVIGVDGRLLSLGAASASSDPGLTKAALDAVQQWSYEPTLLNGEPVEVTTTIAVTFRLQ